MMLCMRQGMHDGAMQVPWVREPQTDSIRLMPIIAGTVLGWKGWRGYTFELNDSSEYGLSKYGLTAIYNGEARCSFFISPNCAKYATKAKPKVQDLPTASYEEISELLLDIRFTPKHTLAAIQRFNKDGRIAYFEPFEDDQTRLGARKARINRFLSSWKDVF